MYLTNRYFVDDDDVDFMMIIIMFITMLTLASSLELNDNNTNFLSNRHTLTINHNNIAYCFIETAENAPTQTVELFPFGFYFKAF